MSRQIYGIHGLCELSEAMCGIVALIACGQPLAERLSVVESMLSRIAHRGPDGEGVHQVPNQAIFGHRRLAIIDIQQGGQPMLCQNKRYTLVFNGEIYNYIELREELEKDGCYFSTSSDSEVLLQSLVHWGESAIGRLNGMFAFVFHDRVDNTWIAARDHFGIKPLYYTTIESELWFASEIKAFFSHPDIQADRDDYALQQYLSLQFCLEDRTLFSGIQKIKPGYFLVGRSNKILREQFYWDTNYQIDHYHTEAYFCEKLRFLLQDSVRLQTRSDVPVGGYLSGGIDSSLVCRLALEHFGEAMPVFHGRFSEGLQYDESEYAKELTGQIGGKYYDVAPTALDFAQSIPSLIEMLDEPLAGPGLFPQYAVSKLAKEHVTVVLGGQGGDEIFGGYARYLVGYLEQALKGAIFETQEEGKHLVTLESIVPNLPLLKQYSPLLSNFWSKGLFQDMDARYFHLIDRSQGLNRLLHPDLLQELDKERLFADFQHIFNHPDTASYINKMTHFDQKTLLPALLQIEDRVSMAVSLESRVPFLDRRIVDLVTSMPPSLKFQGGKTKHILKKTICNLLPGRILHRKDKMGFPVPINEWMQGGVVRDFVADVLLSKNSLQRGIFSSAALYSMLDQQGVGSRQLWGALSLELWHQNFID